MRRDVNAAQRKLLFFMAWANERGDEEFGGVAMAVGAELERHGQAAARGGQPRQEQQRHAGGKIADRKSTLIEEML